MFITINILSGISEPENYIFQGGKNKYILKSSKNFEAIQTSIYSWALLYLSYVNMDN